MYGDLGFVGMSFQSSWGTENTSSLDYLPIISESITDDIDQIVTQTLQARFEEGPSYMGLETFKGDIVMEMHPIHVGKLLKAWCGQESGALVGSVYTHDFIGIQSDWDQYAALPPFTLEVFRDNGSSSYLLYDMQMDALTFEISAGALWRTTASVIGGKFKKRAKGTPSYVAGSGYTYDVTSVQLGGAANGLHSKFTIKCLNKLKSLALLDGTRTVSRIKRGDKRVIEVAGTAVYVDDAQYDIYRAGTNQAFKLNARGQSLTTSQNADFSLWLPQLRIASYPANIGGPGMIEVQFNASAKYDESSSFLGKFSIQNTRVSY